MQSLSTLMSDIFQVDNISMSKATTRLSQLPIISAGQPRILQMLSLARIAQANAYSSTVSEEFVQAIDFLISENANEEEARKAYDAAKSILGDAGTFAVCNINGAQVRARWTETAVDESELVLFTVDNNGVERVIVQFAEDIAHVRQIGSANLEAIGLFNGSSFTVTWDSIVETAITTSANNQCLIDIIRQTQADGQILVSQVKDICEKYSPTKVITGILDQVRGFNNLSYAAVLGIVGQAIVKGNAEYVEGNEFFSPYKRPEYETDVLGLVISILVSTIAVILSVIFKAIAGIIAVLSTIIQTITSLITKNITKVSSKIVKSSDLPVWNFPVGLWNLSNLSDLDKLELDDVIGNFGCAVELNPIHSELELHSLVRWILPTGSSGEYICQLLPLATMPVVSSYRMTRIVESDDAVPAVTFAGTGSADSDYHYPEDMSEYVSYDDAQLCRALFTNLMLSYGSYGGYVRQVEKVITRPQQMNSVRAWLDAIDGVSGQNDRQKVAFAFAVLTLLSTKESYDSVITNYDNVYALLTWEPFINSVNQSDTYFFRPDRTFFPGNDVVTPAVEYPQLSRSSLLQALLITSLTAVVVAGSSFSFKQWRKRKAVARLTLREKQFADAQYQYNSNPSNENLDALYKANKKLSRSWKMAGKTGVNSYNGFSTGSSESIINTLGSANGAAYSYQNDTAVSLERITKILADSDGFKSDTTSSLNKIAKLINGSGV